MSWHDLALAQESCRGRGTFSPLLTANVCITVMKLSTLCIIYSIAMSLGNWFSMHEQKGWDRGGGLVHPESENSMAIYGLAVKIPQ